MDRPEKVNEFVELATQLPEGLRSDWKGTNHYELTSSEKDEYWWLDIPDVFASRESWSGNGDGQRLGLIMDIAATAKESGSYIASLEAEREKLRRCIVDFVDNCLRDEKECPYCREAAVLVGVEVKNGI